MLSHHEIELIKKITIDAGKKIINLDKNKVDVFSKLDNSPLTLADLESNKLICNALNNKFESISIVSEENESKDLNKIFFLIDPLDGTKEFIEGSPDFTVNIALIEDTNPLFGFIYAPVYEKLYWNNSKFSFLSSKNKEKKIFCRGNLIEIDLEISKSHYNRKTGKFLDSFQNKTLNYTGSSLKLCKLAEGISNIYPRYGTTMEWDIAAGHSILKKAGGEIFISADEILSYRKENFKNSEFIAIGTKTKYKKVVDRFLNYM